MKEERRCKEKKKCFTFYNNRRSAFSVRLCGQGNGNVSGNTGTGEGISGGNTGAGEGIGGGNTGTGEGISRGNTGIGNGTGGGNRKNRERYGRRG